MKTTRVHVLLTTWLLMSGAFMAQAFPGPTVYFKFDETSGATAADSSGNGNNGTFDVAPFWIGGQVNNAVNFDGATNVLDVPTSPTVDITGTQLTICGWIMPAATPNVLVDMPYNNTDIATGTDTQGYQLGLETIGDNSMILYFHDSTGGLQNRHTDANFVPMNVWTHFAVVWDGVQLTWYQNATIAAQTGLSGLGGLAARQTPMRIGGDVTTNRLFNGALDEFRIFTNALRQIDIRTLMDPTQTAPIVKITSPADGTIVANEAPITLTAHAEAISGRTITNVHYYVDGGPVSTNVTVDPYTVVIAITNIDEGSSVTHQITAVATDSANENTTSDVINVTVQPPPPLPHMPAMGTGDLVADLLAADLLNNTSTIWTNHSGYPTSVGNFHTSAGNPLAVNTSYQWQTHNLPAVDFSAVSSTANALVSAVNVPAYLTGNNPVSVEAWVFANAYRGNSDVLAYGIQGGSGAPKEDREFICYHATGASKCTSYNFGGRDMNWGGSPEAGNPSLGTWHYVAWTYFGTNSINTNIMRAFADGVIDCQNDGLSTQGLLTPATRMIVGAGEAGGNTDGTALTDRNIGLVASVRVWSGVLSSDQIANNYAAGPFADVPIQLFAPIPSYAGDIYQGGALTLSVSAITNISWPMTYQWYTDSGSAGASWTAVTGATGLTYSPDTSTLETVEYQVAATNTTAAGAGAVSPPVTVNVVTCSTPSVGAVAPASQTVFAGSPATFTVSATGPGPLHYQWRKNGSTPVGSNSSSYTIAAVATGNAGTYDCVVTNGCNSVTATAGTLAVGPLVLTNSFSAGALTLTWPVGHLLQSTNVRGPWTTNTTAASPFVLYPATNGPAMFFRVQNY